MTAVMRLNLLLWSSNGIHVPDISANRTAASLLLQCPPPPPRTTSASCLTVTGGISAARKEQHTTTSLTTVSMLGTAGSELRLTRTLHVNPDQNLLLRLSQFCLVLLWCKCVSVSAVSFLDVMHGLKFFATATSSNPFPAPAVPPPLVRFLHADCLAMPHLIHMVAAIVMTLVFIFATLCMVSGVDGGFRVLSSSQGLGGVCARGAGCHCHDTHVHLRHILHGKHWVGFGAWGGGDLGVCVLLGVSASSVVAWISRGRGSHCHDTCVHLRYTLHGERWMVFEGGFSPVAITTC